MTFDEDRFETCQGDHGVKMAWVPLSYLRSIEWDRNPKLHDISLIQQSAMKYGALDGPVINADNNTLLAGHGRVETYQRMFDVGSQPPGRVRVVNGEWQVATQIIHGLGNDNHAGAAIAMNRSVELGGWDDEKLADCLADVDDVSFVGFSDDNVPIGQLSIPDPIDGFADDELNDRSVGRMRRNESSTEVVAVGRFIGAAPKELTLRVQDILESIGDSNKAAGMACEAIIDANLLA